MCNPGIWLFLIGGPVFAFLLGKCVFAEEQPTDNQAAEVELEFLLAVNRLDLVACVARELMRREAAKFLPEEQ
ncbi:hypothetical protein ABZ769_11395 [Streptomyces olivoreticuli]